MGTVVIEKYVGEKCVEVQEFPASPLRFLAKLLPKQAWSELDSHGLNLGILLNDKACAENSQWLDVEEGAVKKRIRISRRD
jgi:hypothetical protein